MSNLFLLGMEHECATRVPDKPLRPFAGTTLFDIYLKKFKALQGCDLFCGQGVALWPGDKRLWAKAEAAGVPIIERSEASAKGHGDYKVIFDFLEGIDAEWIVRVNDCAPFLQARTLRKFARLARMPIYGWGKPPDGVTAVRPARGWYWDDTGAPIGEHRTNTQACPDWSVATHGVHVFEKRILLETGRCWERKHSYNPHTEGVFEPFEWIDIDTEEDFDLARRVAESFTEEEWAELYRLPTP